MGIDVFEKLSGEPKRILIVKPSSLGDVVHTLPAVADVKGRFPKAEIFWLVNTEWAPLLEGNRHLAGVMEFPRRQWRGWRDWGKARRWARENVTGLGADVTIDFQGLLRSGLLTRASGAGLKIGFKRAREGARFFYDVAVDVPDWDGLHAVDRYRRLVSGEGGAVFEMPAGEAVDLGGEPVPEVLLHPFSRGRGKSLCFSEVVDFCEALAPRRVGIVGAGFSWPEGLALPGNGVDFLNGTSLGELIWLMRGARFTVSVDSGPMHVAAGISPRVLSIHTWTDPRMVGPYRKDAWVFREGEVLRVGEVLPGQFREERARKSDFREGEPLLEEGWIGRIAGKVAELVEAEDFKG